MKTLPRLLAAIFAAVLLSVVAIPTSVVPKADALNGFDTEVLRLINQHRKNLGLQPFVEWQPLSEAARKHSSWMASGTGATCAGSPGSRYRHGSLDDIRNSGMPPQVNGFAENIFYQCGFNNFDIDADYDGLTYAGLPSNCRQGYGSASALRMFCGWINSDPHRRVIEDPRYTYIGLGTVWSDKGGGELHMYATNRFAQAPVTNPAPSPSPSSRWCDGKRVTVDIGQGQRPTNRADVIIGTSGADVINGLGGNDVICGLGGNDTLNGGNGDDVILAGNGNDVASGGAGKDRIRGQNGSDTLYGGDGNDNLNGNNGNDRVYGGSGHDYVSGRDGRDVVSGGTGNDTVRGGGKEDTLRGDDGNDTLFGDGSGDQMFGGRGNDALSGGSGADVLRGEQGNDALDGNAGNDTLRGDEGSDSCVGRGGRDNAAGCETKASIP